MENSIIKVPLQKCLDDEKSVPYKMLEVSAPYRALIYRDEKIPNINPHTLYDVIFSKMKNASKKIFSDEKRALWKMRYVGIKTLEIIS